MKANQLPTLEKIIEDLETLPSFKLEEVADYIRRLRGTSRGERFAAIEQGAGILTDEEGAEMERIIAEGCEKIGSEV